MNGPCWLGEGRELGAVEVNLTSHEPFQREKSHDVQEELHAYDVDVAVCMSVCLYANIEGVTEAELRWSWSCSCHLTPIVQRSINSSAHA